MQGYFADMLWHGEPVLLTRYDVVTHVAVPVELLTERMRRRLGLSRAPHKPRPSKRVQRKARDALIAHLRRAKRKAKPKGAP
jgi:hypothetical protein